MKPTKTGSLTSRSALREQIDDNLKRVYQAALTEDIPDRFKELLEQLKAKETP